MHNKDPQFVEASIFQIQLYSIMYLQLCVYKYTVYVFYMMLVIIEAPHSSFQEPSERAGHPLVEGLGPPLHIHYQAKGLYLEPRKARGLHEPRSIFGFHKYAVVATPPGLALKIRRASRHARNMGSEMMGSPTLQEPPAGIACLEPLTHISGQSTLVGTSDILQQYVGTIVFSQEVRRDYSRPFGKQCAISKALLLFRTLNIRSQLLNSKLHAIASRGAFGADGKALTWPRFCCCLLCVCRVCWSLALPMPNLRTLGSLSEGAETQVTPNVTDVSPMAGNEGDS